jgi:PEP-CTERM motif-containing protein
MNPTRLLFSSLAFALLTLMALAPGAHATLIGTVPVLPGDTVVPGLVPTATPTGTLLASLSAPFTTSVGTDSGTIISAVFREGGGLLDFYYQIVLNTASTDCGGAGQPACDPISRETDTSFLGFTTAVGFRTDGSTLPGGVFADGTVAPVTADRNSVGNVVGFSFNPPNSAKIQPGQTSNVLVISTNATNFNTGFVSVIDGGVTTVNSFEPTGSPQTPTPEPSTLMLFGSGLIGLGALRRRFGRS